MSPRIVFSEDRRLNRRIIGYSLREIWPLVVAAVASALIVGLLWE